MLWGCTNPLIKLGSKGVTDLPKRSHPVLQFLSETFFLFTRWQVGGDFNSRLTIRDLRLRLVRCAVPGSISAQHVRLRGVLLVSGKCRYLISPPPLAGRRGSLTHLHAEISLVVPITNSLTFLFTTVTSQLLGETRGVNQCTLFRFSSPAHTHSFYSVARSSYTRRHGSRPDRSVHLCHKQNAVRIFDLLLFRAEELELPLATHMRRMPEKGEN